MRKEKKVSRRHLLLLSAFFVAVVLGFQLVAATAWTADAANEGPGIVILQMSDDPDTTWAVKDLQRRFAEFISDDPFFPDRVRVVSTSDPYMAMELEGRIVIYVSHGGPLGIVTGNHLTSWKTMATIVEKSDAILHLFAACSSRNIIRFGSEESGKKLYTVPGARPAEVTNVEITATVMLALGLDADYVEEYRTLELERAKVITQSGSTVHIMDFEEIILSEIETIDETYDDTYTSTHKVYRTTQEVSYFSTNVIPSALPSDLVNLIQDHYGGYLDGDGIYTPRNLQIVDILYLMNYYIESNYIIDEPIEDPPPIDEPDPIDPGPTATTGLLSPTYVQTAAATTGHWENSTPVFTGGTYSGYFLYYGDAYSIWPDVYVNVAASGSSPNQVDSISLNQTETGGIRVERVKVDGVWQESVADRVPGRTGGIWLDPASDCDYEYDALWPVSSSTLTDWQYRKVHHLGASGGAGTNYQVRVTVHSGDGTDSGEHVYLNGKCQSDLDDIRFTSADGTTLLDYWTEPPTLANARVFWVEVADNLDYDTSIYIYYGNPSVSSASNGEATFIQFDDFSGTTLADFWAEAPGTGTIEVMNDNLQLSVAAGVNGDWWGGSTHYAPIVYSNAPTHRFEAVVKINWYDVNLNTHAGIMVYQDRDNAYLFGRYRSSAENNYKVEKIINNAGSHLSTYSATGLGTLLRAQYLGGEYDLEISFDEGRTWSEVQSETELRPSYIGLFAKEWGANSIDALFDYWYVRKTNYGEPTHISWGNEETTSMNNWSHRKEHTILGSQGAGTNYQIKITAHYGPGTDSGEHVYLGYNSQNDFDDIRFTDWAGNALNYYRESYVLSGSATFWVEVGANLDTDKKIYLYYGNPTASTTSDGEATFLFFDDFIGTSLDSSKWTIDQGSVEVSSGRLHVDGAIGDNKAYFYSNDGWRENIKQEVRAIISTPHPNAMRCASFIDTDYSWNDFIDGQFYHSSYSNYFRARTANDFQIGGGYSNFVYYSINDITQWHVYSSYWIPGEVGWAQDNLLMTPVHTTYIPDGEEDLSVFFSEAGVIGDDMDVDWVRVRKFVDSEPTHGSWGEAETLSNTGQGTIESSGDYIFASNLPEAIAGWTGPTYIRSLPSIFKLTDFGSFSANMSLLHGGSDLPMTRTSVCLYDIQKRPVFRLMVRDGSAYSESQTLRTIYYDEDGTEYMYETGLIPGDFNGVLSIRYDPLIGLIAKTPNEVQHLLIPHNEMGSHLGRTIKFVGIESERYRDNVEHDERIFSIRASYCGSDYSVFHEDCNNIDSFNPDNDFGMIFIKEDAEDGDTTYWNEYSGTGIISNDLVDGDRAIFLQGDGMNTGYRFPYSSSDYWNEPNKFVIQWSMKYSEYFKVYISVDTTAGHRYMQYYPVDTDALGTGEYVDHGLGTTADDGRWHTFQRNLEADLHEAQPTVDIIDINAILIRGSGYIDDIKLLSYQSVKEDAEDGRTTGWDEYSGTGNVYNVLDGDRRVIQLLGSGTSTGYRYPYSSSDYWNDADHLTIQWSMKYSETYRIYISVDTTAGHRYMTYDPVDVDNLGTSEYVFHGLGSDTKDGQWHTFSRDLLADLREAQPTVDIIDVNTFLIRGSGYLDNIMLLPHDSGASLEVPLGESFIRPSISSRPATNTWHGGMFTQALDRPFRLYQLSDFSVRAAVDQVSSNRMGKTFVGLFDENMKCVFWVYVGDSWAGNTNGYIRTAYYPENGGGYFQAPDYISTDFDKTGRLWYDRGTNTIKSIISGEDTTTLASVDNPERVIMYLVVNVKAYDHYDLLDMRIHDINIDTNVRTAPPEMQEPPSGEDPIPARYDGTVSGGDKDPDNVETAETSYDSSNTFYSAKWTLVIFWPVLLMQLLTTSAVEIWEATVDLVGAFTESLNGLSVWLNDLIESLQYIISVFMVFISYPIALAFMNLWWIALGAWMAFDALRLSGVGLLASAAAALFAGICTLSFLAGWHAFVIGVAEVAGYVEAAELYAGMYIALCMAIFGPKTIIFLGPAALGWKYAIASAQFFVGFEQDVFGWNPVISIARILFKLGTLAFMAYWIYYYVHKALQEAGLE